jgi:hypothetical protein
VAAGLALAVMLATERYSPHVPGRS